MNPLSRCRCVCGLAALLILTACQGMDRLEPDRLAETGSGAEPSRGTMLDGSASAGLRAAGPLTEEIASRWLREIQAAEGEARLALAQEFWRQYPAGDVLYQVHELVGDAHSQLGRPREAARAWERAIATSWPAPDLLELPLTNPQLPYEIGWARYEAGDAAAGAAWLTRATFISDRPQLDQGLRFLYADMGSPEGDFSTWSAALRQQAAVVAPDFELPGLQTESMRLSEMATKLTLINFWSPT